MPLPSLEALKLSQDAKLQLFSLDLSPIGQNLLYYFCPEKDTNGNDVVFQGKTYVAHPIIADGFERSNRGQPANPKLVISNIGGIISALFEQNQGLTGAKVTRQKTYAKYLDNGSSPDPTMEFTPDVYFISRKPEENDVQITVELRDIASFGNKRLPGRRMQKYSCPFRYRGAECGYTGAKYFTKNDVPTNDPALDRCGLRLTSCQLRFGKNNELNHGGFPGIDA